MLRSNGGRIPLDEAGAFMPVSSPIPPAPELPAPDVPAGRGTPPSMQEIRAPPSAEATKLAPQLIHTSGIKELTPLIKRARPTRVDTIPKNSHSWAHQLKRKKSTTNIKKKVNLMKSALFFLFSCDSS
ncbi:hypothetical protein GBA52_015470 [Prunus armeniaca]|nr:hypothetical protein GBA52_015470 [Prunus armeniaca]